MKPKTTPAKFFQGVQIHDVSDPSYSYLAKTEKECRDAVDRSIYQEVVRLMDCVTMGSFVGCPHFEM